MMDKLKVGSAEDLANWSRELGDKLKLSGMSEKPTTGPSTKGMIKIAETKIVTTIDDEHRNKDGKNTTIEMRKHQHREEPCNGSASSSIIESRALRWEREQHREPCNKEHELHRESCAIGALAAAQGAVR
jgi:hypothetical protein